MAGFVRRMMVVGVVVGTVACSRKAPTPTLAAASIAKASAPVAKTAGGDGKLDPNDPKHGTRKLMGLDAPVYVDGVQIAVLRAGELPALRSIDLEGGGRRWRVYDYLKAVGVDMAALKSVHFHGNGDRIGSIEGTELRKEKDRFQFSFTSGDTGAPLQQWDTDGLKNDFVIHEIRRMTIYVQKPSPTIKPGRRCHIAADGDCSDAIPYASGEIAKGTRVYLDGKMIGFVKRRQIGDAVVAGELPDGSHFYSVARLIKQMGVDVASVKTVELAAGDDVVARATGSSSLDTFASKTTFTLPPHNHGKVRFHVPAALQSEASTATDRDALVSAVLLYKNTTPVTHDLVTISEDTDLAVQLAAIDGAPQGGQDK